MKVNELEHRDDVSIPWEWAFKKAEGETVIETFRLVRSNLLIPLPSRALFTSVKLSATPKLSSIFFTYLSLLYLFL